MTINASQSGKRGKVGDTHAEEKIPAFGVQKASLPS